ncbi:MAG: hypothetical protein HY934_08110 [Candidatus Firestonebacteria bacterium]|nr:hypothetical protein [Candidatus Firestonebacteria bacterium]
MSFKLTDHSHDIQLRKLLENTPMPGAIEVSYCREPNFYHGVDVCGKLNQTIIYEKDNIVQSMACRYIKPMFINGEVKNFGYLSGLRISADYRKGVILGKGYNELKNLHSDKKTPGYISTIIENNLPASNILESGRATLPKYKDIGKYYVYMVFFNRFIKHKRNKCEILDNNKVSLNRIIDFINRYGPERQFFPYYQECDFMSNYTRDFNTKDFLVAVDNSEILGVIGIWDQQKFKQNVISNYNGIYSYAMPFINSCSSVLGFRSFPKQKEAVQSFIISFICIKNNNTFILTELLKAAYRKKLNETYHGFLIGFHERDPLRESITNFIFTTYISRAYLVYWKDGSDFCEKYVDNRIPYFELGTL